MASIIPDYEYDIFISYRQNDNRSGWVTEFVTALQEELAATLKESVSVYFDTNPHDGLLETYNVEKSLEAKLKCLIFIPIISQTYCDPKSFAWQHEFAAFNKMAKEDQFGRDIKLAGGNVASRILPIKIHDLDAEDKALLENELGGVLRSIDFIYKALGVNRPLKPNDERSENLNHTYYRDQINKVANAVKEIIIAIKKPNQQDREISKEVVKSKPERPKKLKTRIIIASVIVLTIIILGCFFVSKLFNSSKPVDKSIAVLPFRLLSNEPDKQYLADGMMNTILLHLQKFKDLLVMPEQSVIQYRGTKKTANVIGQELDVGYLLEGNFQKFGDSVMLIVQLIKVGGKGYLWAKDYKRNWKDIFFVQTEVAQAIAGELHTIITPKVKELITKVPTTNLTAYDLYLKANESQKDYQKTRNLSSYQRAVNFYTAALEIDSAFAKAYTGLASTYYDRYRWENYFKEDFLDSCLILVNKALTFDDQLDEAYYLKGLYYWANGHIEEALNDFDEALSINPNFYLVYVEKGLDLRYITLDIIKGIDNYNKALKFIRGDERPDLLRKVGRAYLDVGFIEKAKYYYQEAFALDSNKVKNFDYLADLEYGIGNVEEALKLAKKANEIDSTYLVDPMNYDGPLDHKDERFILAKKIVEYYKKSGELNLQQSHRVGYAFWQVGKYKEAEYYFNQQIKYSEESIKLNRDIAQWKGAQYDLAATYAFLGNKIKAYKYLDEFNTMNFYPLWWVAFLKHDPLFNSIRNEERFQKILQNVETKNQAEHERVRKWMEEQGKL